MSTLTVSAGLHTTRRPVRRSALARVAAAPRVRLTRRGRLLLTGVVLLLLVGGLLLAGVVTGGVPASAGSEPGHAAVAERVTVRPGDTLWAIALREAPGVDPRATVAEILDLNALDSSAVEAGSVLLLPAR